MTDDNVHEIRFRKCEVYGQGLRPLGGANIVIH